MNNARFRLTAVAAVALLLAACGSTGGLGDIFGTGTGTGTNYPTTQSAALQGTVNSVDTRNQRIDLTVYDYNNQQRSTTIYYNSGTRVYYQNQSGSPSQLERGDRVDIQGTNNNGQYIADTITVVQSMSSSSTTYPGNTYPNSASRSILGTVSNVDLSARRVDLTSSYVNGLRTSQSNFSFYFDTNTRVLYQGRTYSPSDLERGDQVEVRAFDNGNSSYLADTITVTRNVRQ